MYIPREIDRVSSSLSHPVGACMYVSPQISYNRNTKGLGVSTEIFTVVLSSATKEESNARSSSFVPGVQVMLSCG